MISRERVHLTLQHRPTDRVPTFLMLTDEVLEKLNKYFRVNSLEEVLNKLDVDVRWFWAEYNGPKLDKKSDGSFSAYWGYWLKPVKNKFGTYSEFAYHPLSNANTVKDVEKYQWPSPDWFDYDGLKQKIEESDKSQERWIGVGESSIFERSWALTGMEKFILDLAMNPEIPLRIMDKVNEFYIEQTIRSIEAGRGRIDMVFTADDVGSQNGMLISPQMWRDYIKPRQKLINDEIKKRFPEIKIFYHSCGSIYPIMNDLIEIGIDILNPIQTSAKDMDPVKLKMDFGNRITFCGGIDVQHTLPYGTDEEVKREVIERIKVFGQNGGYILSPTHSVQPDTPLKNLFAMFEAINEYNNI